MTNRSALTLFLCLGALASPAAVDELSGSQPNIIVILTDDMGYSDLGCFGSEIQTPNLDRLADKGIRFTQMYNTSKCWTTRISLLTGLYHQRSDRSFANTALAGEVLRPAGYRTWWSGKHHASFNPYDRGFDHFAGFLGGAINFWNPDGRTPREGEPVPGWGANYDWAFDGKIVKDYLPEKGFYATDDFTDWALDWLREDTDQDKPFFLYLAYNAPHWPLHAHPEDIAKYKGVYDEGYESIRQQRYQRQLKSGLFASDLVPLSPPEHRDWDSISSEEKAKEALRMQIHAAMVDRVDQNVGRLLEQLEKNGQLDHTLILVLVDNGASHEKPGRRGPKDTRVPMGSVGSFEAIGQSWANAVNTPLRKWKVQGLEGGICTPMIAHWPRGITTSAGAICREPCHLIDLLPTFIELAGENADYPVGIPAVDGVSLVPLLKGKDLHRSEPLFFQYGSWQVIRDNQWKLVQQKSKPWELYDLSQDRTETRNLASQRPDRVAEMKQRWMSWYRDCTGKAWKVASKK